ncbi:MAG: efflux RND transporter permease subunit [Flavobacteriales bacterium]|nr:efflux RND transporter permease subunit [Flavobacteriales bacterium]
MSKDQKEKKYKEFGLSTLSVNNRTSVFVLTGIIILFGLVSYITMPKAAFPDIVMPQIYVGTPYPGNSPIDIEKLITRPIEKEINAISEVEKLTSNSIQGYSVIIAEFESTMTPSEALQKVKDAVDKAKAEPSFPDDLPAEPNIFEMNFSEFPILNINLSGNFSVDQLNDYAEYLQDKIEDLDEISEVNIRGVQEKEVEVSLDLYKMESMMISFQDVENALAYENMTISGGDILTDGFRRTVRVVGDYENIDEMKNTIVKQEKFNIVYLRDIADVSFDFQEATSYAREFLKPVVMLDVVKGAGKNLLDASDKINDILDHAKTTEFPQNLEVSVTNDQSSQTRDQVNNLENSIISGVILVVLVLLFFLGLRNALFVGIAIPLSMFMSFMILSFMGVTINMMVLFALILALGMLVDNGIVVVENIYRLMDEGMKPIEAAKKGVGEVAWPIIASTATTLAAFLPLALWPGMMGEFMGFLPITLMIVLGSSLFVGLVINPVFTSVWMKVGVDHISTKKVLRNAFILIGISIPFYVLKVFGFANLLAAFGIFILINHFIFTPFANRFQSSFMPWVEEIYKKSLKFALTGSRPRFYLLGTFGLLICSFILVGAFTPKVEFFPINMPKYVNVFIEKPIGTDIEEVDVITRQVEEKLKTIVKKYEVNGDNFLIESIIAQVGEGTSDPARGPALGATPHKGRVQVSFVDFKYRFHPTEDTVVNTLQVMKEIREGLKNQFPGVQITVAKDEAGPPTGLPINIEVIGDDYMKIMAEALKIKTFINSKNIGGIEELQLDIDMSKPELLVDIDREKARRLNLSTAQIASSIRTALFGKEVSQYKDGEDDYPINLRLKNRYRYDLDALMNMKITFRDQMTGQFRQVPISAVATPKKGSTFSAVNRKNMNRLIVVGSNVKDGYNANEVVDNIKKIMEDYPVPGDVQVKFTGQMEEQAKEMSFLGQALMIAVFLIFLIIVSQFNSAGTPFIIVGSVVFSLIGVLLGLVIFQMDFIIIMTMIGIISLAGVVVNNAIVLIDYTNLIMKNKKKELNIDEEDPLPLAEIIDSIVEGGKTRLRPVLLTAITTVLGLLPLATGMNINFFTLFSEFDAQIYFGGDNVVFWGPMSWTVIFGLTFATFLTLVIVPVMYLIKFKMKYRKRFKKAVIPIDKEFSA